MLQPRCGILYQVLGRSNQFRLWLRSRELSVSERTPSRGHVRATLPDSANPDSSRSSEILSDSGTFGARSTATGEHGLNQPRPCLDDTKTPADNRAREPTTRERKRRKRSIPHFACWTRMPRATCVESFYRADSSAVRSVARKRFVARPTIESPAYKKPMRNSPITGKPSQCPMWRATPKQTAK